MKQFERIFPQGNLFFVYIYAISSMAYFFNPSWIEVGVGLIIDALAFFLVFATEKEIFYRVFPSFKVLKEYFADNKFKTLDNYESQSRFYNLLSSFPEKRAVFIFIMSFVKVLPVGIYLSLLGHNSNSFAQNLLLFYLIDAIVLFFCSSLVFIELHSMASSIMRDLSSNREWSVNYRHLTLSETKNRFTLFQNYTLILMLVDLCAVMLSSGGFTLEHRPLAFIVMCVTAIISIGVILVKFQSFTENSLKGMFSYFENSIKSTKSVIIPLHTSPLLAGFEYSFNQLGYKLEQREKEIANWLKLESEQFHLRALGEITALVAHDIKTPLHVMQMSLEVLNDPSAASSEKEKYSQILEKNLNQTISFTQSLMAHLKGAKDSNECSFGDVHHHLIDLMSTQFSSENFHIIDFDIQDVLKDLKIGINRLDAMHVFYNLYHNAIRAILDSDNTEKHIKLWTEANGAIYLFDNGPGLSKEDFSQFISYERFGDNESFNRSLGLRLTHTLVNRLGGDLELIPVSEGTCYKIKLPLFDSPVPNWSQLDQGQTAPDNVISHL